MTDDPWSSGGAPRKKRFEEELDDLLAANPFDPFHVVMNSGERFQVANRYMLVPGDTVLTLYRREEIVHLRVSAISHVNVEQALTSEAAGPE